MLENLPFGLCYMCCHLYNFFRKILPFFVFCSLRGYPYCCDHFEEKKIYYFSDFTLKRKIDSLPYTRRVLFYSQGPN